MGARIYTLPVEQTGWTIPVSGATTTLTWDYDSTALLQIDGFKVYRVIVPATTFSAVADNIPTAIPLQWIDAGGGCGMGYYVVAVYTDLNGVRRETGPSTNSWYSQACPTPSP